MGKMIKYCGSCDESFVKRFGSCPNCGAELLSFELYPVEVASTEPAIETVPPLTAANSMPIKATPVSTVTRAIDVDKNPTVVTAEDDDLPETDNGFHVTVIEDKNVATRNGLLLTTFGFMICALLLGVVVSIFGKDMDIGAINDDLFNSVIADTTPMTVEEEHINKEDAKKGGGGGGNSDLNPASQGVRPPMRKDPGMAPSTSMDRLTNPSIPVQMAIKGPIDEEDTNRSQPYGLKYGSLTLSDGPGGNGGIGTGRDGGVGDSTGPGYGPGKKGGLGGGPEGGMDSKSNVVVGPPPPPVGVTQAMRIIAKPRP
ncbi:MAG: hypothetical protein ABJA02_06990 [Acidobacteriota bacterium]